MNKTLAIALLTIPAFAAFAAPAAAATDDANQVVVSYGDLDLSHKRGADALLRRIHRATRLACGMPRGRIPLEMRSSYRECMRGAADQAVAQINHPTVMARYIERTGRDPRSIVLVARADD